MKEAAATEDDERSWREMLLHRLLITSTPLVLAAVAMGIVGSTGRNRLTFLLVLPAIAVQIAAVFRRHWPYALRAWILIAPLVIGACLTYYLTCYLPIAKA